jgi:hypothetical protein
MKQHFFKLGVIWCLVIALVAVVPLCLIGSPPAAAQFEEEYFQFSYEPVIYSKTEIQNDEVFTATIEGRVTCNNDLPISVSKARITSNIIAEHAESGSNVTLNSYTMTIEPFPNKPGDIIVINEVIYLQFPDRSESGDYNIIGKPFKVEIPFLFGWIDVSKYLPQDLDQPMGTLKYISADKSPTPNLTPTVTPIPTATSTPTPGSGIGTGIWVGIGVAIISLIALG